MENVGRERLGGAEMSALELYNTKIAAYRGLCVRLAALGLSPSIVRHDEFAIDQPAVFPALAPYLEDPVSVPVAIEASTKDADKDRAYYRDYYGSQRWRDIIDSESMARINETINWSELADFGYTPDRAPAAR